MIRILINIVILFFVLHLATPNDMPMIYHTQQNCFHRRCEVCTDRKLICESGFMESFPNPIKSQNKYFTNVFIKHANFKAPVLYRGLFENFKGLHTFKLTHSNLKVIKEFTFDGLWNLTNVHLGSNKIRTVGSFAFFGCTLRKLFFDGNYNINFALNAFDGLIITEKLSLTRCNLKTIAYPLLKPVLQRLSGLVLSSNRITSLSSKFENNFANIRLLKVLALDNNPLVCDCKSVWLLKVLKFRFIYYGEVKKQEQNYPKCINLNNTNSIQVMPDSMGCFDPYVQRLSLFSGAGKCDALITCLSSQPVKSIEWFRYSTKVSEYVWINTKTKHYKLINHLRYNLSSTLCITRRVNASYICMVGNLSVAQITIDRGRSSSSSNSSVHITVDKFQILIYSVIFGTLESVTVIIFGYATIKFCCCCCFRPKKNVEGKFPIETFIPPPAPPLPITFSQEQQRQQQEQPQQQPLSMYTNSILSPDASFTFPRLPKPASKLYENPSNAALFYDYPRHSEIW